MLRALNGVPTDIIDAWTPLVDGMSGAVRACRTASKVVGWGEDGTWSADLTSAKRHAEIAQEGAFAAMFMSMARVEREGDTYKHRGGLRFNLQEDMKGTEIGKVMEALMNTQGKSDHESNEYLKGAGFGDDPPGLADDPMRSCGNCGRTDGQLLKCTGCEGQVYCSAECQTAHWKEHKKCCSKLLRGCVPLRAPTWISMAPTSRCRRAPATLRWPIFQSAA